MEASTYVTVLFIATTLFTLGLFYRAFAKVSTPIANKVLLGSLAWLGVQGIILASGFYLKTDTLPPRFALAVAPAIIAIVYFLRNKNSANVLNQLSLKDLTLLHVCRIPVEFGLLGLYKCQQIPEIMTFEGLNFDILSGLTALPMAWFAFQNNAIKRTPLLIWNVVCLALVCIILVIAILSVATPLQQFGFEQPNVGVLKFPYGWLPSFIVPVVLFAHLVAIRRLWKGDVK
jgi:hypothetical protein